MKVDHNLTDEQPLLRALQLPEDAPPAAGVAAARRCRLHLRRGDGNIKGQSFAFNDTHTLSSNWLNEFRFGWSSIKFNMTPIDYGANPGAGGRPAGHQPESGDLGDDAARVPEHPRTWAPTATSRSSPTRTTSRSSTTSPGSKGSHTVRTGGSLTLRSREILNADTIVGNFNFNNNMTSNCAGLPAGCTRQQQHRLRRRQLHARPASTPRPAALFDAETYTEKRPEYRRLHPGRLSDDRSADAQPGPALGRVSAVDRDRQPAVELRRIDRQVRRRLRRRRRSTA